MTEVIKLHGRDSTVRPDVPPAVIDAIDDIVTDVRLLEMACRGANIDNDERSSLTWHACRIGDALGELRKKLEGSDED